MFFYIYPERNSNHSVPPVTSTIGIWHNVFNELVRSAVGYRLLAYLSCASCKPEAEEDQLREE